MRKITFQACSVVMTLFYKDTAKAPATFLNELSQNESDYNIDNISGDFTIYTMGQAISQERKA